MKGFGTVVTGTLLSGAIAKEDELEVFPSGKRVRVRDVQVHGGSADKAMAGQRTALNLAGATTEELARGMTLAPARTAPGDENCRRLAFATLHGQAAEEPRPCSPARVHQRNHRRGGAVWGESVASGQ